MRVSAGALVVMSVLLTAAPAWASDLAERAYARGDYVLSAELLLPEARRGYATAQSILGYQYQNGMGVPKSEEEAARWFRRAAQQGEPNVQFFFGLLYDRGQGVPEDPVTGSAHCAQRWNGQAGRISKG